MCLPFVWMDVARGDALAAPGALSITVALLSAGAVFIRAQLIQTFGNQGAYAAAVLAFPLFIAMIGGMFILPFPDTALGLYVYMYPLWAAVLCLILAAYRSTDARFGQEVEQPHHSTLDPAP